MNIGQLFLELLADDARLKPQVEAAAAKAGDAGAKTLGQRLSAGLKDNGIKAFGVAFAGVAGVVTKGALEMENATARFASETGLSMDEAKAAMAGINKVAGEQQMSLDQVTEAAIRVKRDLGLSGQAATDATSSFAEFARVTRQDAAGAVSAFDDILDSWGLTAADATQIMDKMLVSQQKFGGSIEENQKTLAALAPAMRAANMSVDDGIALLGLFGAKGLDAGQASAAFAKALTKVKSPEELQRLIDDIANTQDPFLRASKAADLFGAKAGAKLANALGDVNLDEYKISIEESTGAVDKAAEKLDSTFGGRFKKMLSEAGAALRGLGSDFGPVLSGLSSIGLLAASVFPDLGPSIGKKLLRGFKLPAAGLKAIGVKVMGMIGVGIAEEAASGAVGDAVGDAVGGAMKSGKLAAATDKLGSFLGSKLGTGLSVAFAAIAWVEVINTYNRIKAELASQSQQISTDVANQVATGTTASLEQSKAALEEGLRQVNEVWDAGIFTTDTRKSLEADLAAVTTELQRRAAGMGPAVAAGVDQGAPAATTAIKEMYGPPTPPLSELHAMGQASAHAYAQGILDKQDDVSAALADLRNQVKTELTPGQEIARTIGVLTSKELAKGLASHRPGVRAEANRVKQVAEDRLATLIAGGGKVGKKAAAELAAGLKSKNPQVRAEAKRVQEIVTAKLNATKTPAATAGQKAAQAFITRVGDIIAAAKLIATFKVTSNTGTGHGKAIGGPVQAGTPYLVNERTPRSEVMVPSTGGYVLTRQTAIAALQGSAGGGGVQISGGIHLHGVGSDVSLGAQRRFAQGVLDVVASGLREQTARTGNIATNGRR